MWQVLLAEIQVSPQAFPVLQILQQARGAAVGAGAGASVGGITANTGVGVSVSGSTTGVSVGGSGVDVGEISAVTVGVEVSVGEGGIA